jgi:hypothetical protein
MATSNPSGAEIVFSGDEAFLARALVMSLIDAGHPSADVRLVLIDIGCGRQTLAWMRNHGVEIVEIPLELIPASVTAVIRPVHRALVVRPFLPTRQRDRDGSRLFPLQFEFLHKYETRAALIAAKVRGQVLGNPRLPPPPAPVIKPARGGLRRETIRAATVMNCAFADDLPLALGRAA